jgi:hypothetical protein
MALLHGRSHFPKYPQHSLGITPRILCKSFFKSSKAASPKNQKSAEEEYKNLFGRSIFFLPEVPNHEIFQKVKNRVVL